MDEIDRYIAATRRSLPDLASSEMYKSHKKIVDSVLFSVTSPTEMRVFYTSERRSEYLEINDKSVICYDQYLGQTLSNFARLTFDSDSTEFTLNYISKVLAEFFRAYGASREAFVFARIHSDEEYKLRKLPRKSRKRLISVFYQELFLMTHEAYHAVLRKSPVLRHSAHEVVNRYFANVESRKRKLGTDQEAETLSPSRADIEPDLIDEMICDFYAYAVVVGTARNKLVFGKNEKDIAALGCFAALKNIQLVNALRASVVAHVRKKDVTDRTRMDFLSHQHNVRARFMNWLCNNIVGGVDKPIGTIVGDIDDYLNKYHDNLATLTYSMCETVVSGKLFSVFREEFEHVDQIEVMRNMDFRERVAVVDVMTGWHSKPEVAVRTQKLLNDPTKIRRLLRPGPQ